MARLAAIYGPVPATPVPEIPVDNPTDCVGCTPPTTPDIPVQHPADCIGCVPKPPVTPEIPVVPPTDCIGCGPVIHGTIGPITPAITILPSNTATQPVMGPLTAEAAAAAAAATNSHTTLVSTPALTLVPSNTDSFNFSNGSTNPVVAHNDVALTMYVPAHSFTPHAASIADHFDTSHATVALVGADLSFEHAIA